MRRFKKGDIVKCIDNTHLITGPNGELLTMGKNYELLKVTYDEISGPNIVYVMNDLGYEDMYRMKRFVLTSEIRRETIEEILS